MVHISRQADRRFSKRNNFDETHSLTVNFLEVIIRILKKTDKNC